jgi:succinate dehydrogenase/fumarate reductase-like Fe-S protein
MSKSLLLMLCILTGLLVLACSKTEETNRNAAAPANANAATAPGATTNRNANANTNSTATAQVGVAECDNFINAYENCVTTKVPEASRAQFRSSISTWRTEWKKLADNPQTRGTLATVCKTQLESARNSMKAYNCTF